MASYLSQPKQFAAYQPEVNAELYGKLIMQKKVDYDAGLEKAQKNLDYVASLPVASERERKYLQDKVHAITTDLNQNTNLDWSDQSVEKITSSHIKSIANDPNIQAAIQSASNHKKGFSSMKSNTEDTEGKNVVNQQSFMDEYNNWEQNGKLGEVFKGQYQNYLDPLTDFDKWYKDKKPNTRIIVTQAGIVTNPNGSPKIDPATGQPVYNKQLAAEQWDATIGKYKQITPEQVKTDFQNFLATNPNYQSQINLNSKYAYKDLGPQDFARKQEQVITKSLENTRRALSDAELEYSKMPSDDPDKEKLRLLIESTKNEDIPGLEKQLSPDNKKEIYQKWQQDPSLVEQAKVNLYQQDLYNTVVGKHAYREDESVSFLGDSPQQRELKMKTYELAKQKTENAQKLKEDKAAAAQKSKFGPEGIAEEGIKTAETKTSWDKFNDQYTTIRGNMRNNKVTYMYDTFGQTGADDKFTFGSDGKPLIKPDVKDSKGNIISSPEADLEKMYEEKYNKYKAGDYSNLGKLDIEHFQEQEKQDRLSNGIQSKIQEAKENWANRPEAKIQSQGLEQLRKFVDEASTSLKQQGFGDQITSKDVTNYVRGFEEVKDTFDKMGFGKKFSIASTTYPKEQDDMVWNIFAKNMLGITNPTENDLKKVKGMIGSITYFNKNMTDKSGNSPLSIYSQGLDKENEFLNDYVKANDYLANKLFIPYIDPKTGYADKIIKQRVIPYLRGKSSSLLDNKTATAIGYVQDPITGDYELVIKGAKGQKDETYAVTRTEANSLGFSDIQQKDFLSQLLKFNRNRGNTGSNTYTKGPDSHTFKDAIPLTDDGKQEVRYHVKEQSGKYAVEFWVRDHTTGKSSIAKDPNTGRPIEAISNSLTDVRIALDDYSKTGSPTTTPSEYYTAPSYTPDKEATSEDDSNE